MPLPQPVPDVVSLDLLKSVAKLGSIRQAAMAHGISQPAASMRLRSLEKALGVAIVDRSNGRATLTPAGLAVVQWSEKVIEGIDELIEGVRALRLEGETNLPIAASMTVAEYLIPIWLGAMRQSGISRSISLKTGNTENVIQIMRNHEADIGFIEGWNKPQEFSVKDVYDDDVVVVVTPSHPWSHRKKFVTPTELANTPLILRESGSGTREILERNLELLELKVTPLAEMASNTAIKAMVLAGSGPGVLSRLVTKSEIENNKLVIVNVVGIKLDRKIRAIWPKNTVLRGPAKELLGLILLQSGKSSTKLN